MTTIFFITHPEVVIDPSASIERWHLSPRGIARMRHFSALPMLSAVGAIWSSTEAKAIEGAGILAGALGLGVRVCPGLGENDRRATGFLPPVEFEVVANEFFAMPDISVRGWERAIDAQARVKRAFEAIVAEHVAGDLAVVAHGAVGTLLYCGLSGQAISRAHDQPFQGHFWQATLPDLRPKSGWRPIAPRDLPE